MKNPLVRLTARLMILSALLATFGATAGKARYLSYFESVFACDDNYTNTLGTCRSNIGYPYDPTESECRYEAGSSYSTCLNTIEEPMPQMNFCSQARAARDNCVNTYGPSSYLDDWDAYTSCIAASGINQCE